MKAQSEEKLRDAVDCLGRIACALERCADALTTHAEAQQSAKGAVDRIMAAFMGQQQPCPECEEPEPEPMCIVCKVPLTDATSYFCPKCQAEAAELQARIRATEEP